MNRCAFFADGFNIYHSLDALPSYYKYKWLNLAKLAKTFIASSSEITSIFYFTTYITWDQRKLARHQIYVRALQSEGVQPVFGEFRRVDRVCKVCHRQYQTFEEKQTDVNIAIKLFETAVTDLWDTAIIISGDSDLIPALKAVKATFPTKKVGIIIPIARRAEELKQAADFHMKIKEKHLMSCQFEDMVIIDKNTKLTRPITWK
ncbi:MAG: NYN domain-containing protein [Candidatus Omnitrophota bacterium]|nr:NYN domain-containing protein [Candidatus Omnitrophota bacterium]MBU1929619.1 NYN domain-containing protein [Candidatus Omnitrophota bacterium]MBU2034812.1 NYN domain-containing protein [Candidatus Omnitrophota bacterium]